MFFFYLSFSSIRAGNTSERDREKLTKAREIDLYLADLLLFFYATDQTRGNWEKREWLCRERRETERDLGENWEEGWAWRGKKWVFIYRIMDDPNYPKLIASNG
jgi:hypothetical protein